MPQVTRKWLNKAGMPTVEHLLHLLADMEGVLQLEVEAEAQQRREGTSTQLDGNSQGDLGRTPRLEPLEEERVRGGRNSEEDGEAAAVSLTREPLESNEEGEGGGGQMDGGHGEGHAEEGGRKLAGDKQHEALEATPP